MLFYLLRRPSRRWMRQAEAGHMAGGEEELFAELMLVFSLFVS